MEPIRPKTVYLMRRSENRDLDRERILRTAFFLDYGISIEAPVFSYGAYGKPYLAGLPYYNLSHSGDYIVCVTDGQEIGIDIQTIKTIHSGVMERFLGSNELEPKQQTLLWTQYESYSKMLGTGIPLEGYGFRNGNYLSAFLSDGYVVTVCTKQISGKELRICPVENNH